jgi:hypothetical protein
MKTDSAISMVVAWGGGVLLFPQPSRSNKSVRIGAIVTGLGIDSEGSSGGRRRMDVVKLAVFLGHSHANAEGLCGKELSPNPCRIQAPDVVCAPPLEAGEHRLPFQIAILAALCLHPIQINHPHGFYSYA